MLAAAAALVVALVVGFVVISRASAPEAARLGGTRATTGPDAASDSSGAAGVVARLERALRTRDAAAAVALAADARAADELRALVRTARALDVRALDLRFVADSTAPALLREQDRLGEDVIVVDVELSWRVAGVDDGISSVEAPVAVSLASGDPRFVTTRLSAGGRTPAWFDEDVEVRRVAPGAVLVATPAFATSSQVAIVRAGLRTVADGVPDWDGRAVVEIPGGVRGFAASSGLDVGSARGIAAVTTSPDGTDRRRGPERVFVNPAVYGPLGPVGQRIVMAHELTHVAVDAATSRMPLWLSEGYADYVALRRSDVGTDVLAAQILRLVREQGPPRRLPTGADFDGADPDVGARYESAWLAVRLLADEYGDATVDRFYRLADRDASTARAFERLGTTEAAFTARWRRLLSDLAAS